MRNYISLSAKTEAKKNGITVHQGEVRLKGIELVTEASNVKVWAVHTRTRNPEIHLRASRDQSLMLVLSEGSESTGIDEGAFGVPTVVLFDIKNDDAGEPMEEGEDGSWRIYTQAEPWRVVVIAVRTASTPRRVWEYYQTRSRE